MAVKAGGRKNGVSLFNGDKVLALRDKKVLEMDGSDGWITM